MILRDMYKKYNYTRMFYYISSNYLSPEALNARYIAKGPYLHYYFK
jgi:hypothetical protein